MAVKLLSLILALTHIDATAGHDVRIVNWIAGKVSAMMFCGSFRLDAILLKRNTVVLWATLTIFAALLGGYFLYFGSHNLR